MRVMLIMCSFALFLVGVALAISADRANPLAIPRAERAAVLTLAATLVALGVVGAVVAIVAREP